MHQVHTLNPGRAHCAQAARTRRRVVACGRPCHGRVTAHSRPCLSARPAVSTPCNSPPPPPPMRTGTLLRISQLPEPYRGASPSRVTPVYLHNPAAKPRVCHDTPTCITTQSLNTQAVARASLALARRPAVSQAMLAVSWHRLGRIVAESWPCRGPQAAPRPHLPSLVSRYNPLYCDSNGQ